MNLDTQDVQLITVSVEAAVAKAVALLVTKEEFRAFRTEVIESQRQFYNREMIDRLLGEAAADRERLWQAIKDGERRDTDTTTILRNLWQNAYVKVGALAAVGLQLFTLYRYLSGK